MNLLEETLNTLKENKKTPQDVRWVGSVASNPSVPGFWHCTWEEFAAVAGSINYDAGYGLNEIEMSLKVVGDDWWLERFEYDGSEWWRFAKHPIRPDFHKVPETTDLTDHNWSDDAYYEETLEDE